MFRIKKGLDIPLDGVPRQEIHDGKPIEKVALLGGDYVGMRPSMEVKVGDRVATGQKVFSCKKTPGVVYTSPASGKVVEINRGERRAFQSLVVARDGDDHVEFSAFTSRSPDALTASEIRNLLVESGTWTAIRTRPYSKVPDIEGKPRSLFVTATDTNPLAPKPELIIENARADFDAGLTVLSRLMEGAKVYLCSEKDLSPPELSNLESRYFTGKHPAGLAGTHIHFVDPVGSGKTVWTIGYQDVIAIGRLFKTGKLLCDRVVSLAGPSATDPRVVKTRAGVDLAALCEGESEGGDIRIVSGSVLNGTRAAGPLGYLGRYHNQVTLLGEDSARHFLGWHMPGLDKFSAKRTFASSLFGSERFGLGTNTHGSPRAMVPVGSYERVMPLDILPTQLLRGLMTGDTEASSQLGCLELDEEDLGLCTFVDPGKNDFGVMLRDVLTTIEREG